MRISKRSKIDGVRILTFNKNSDHRDSLMNTFDTVALSFITNSMTCLNYGPETNTKKDVISGIHYQIKKPQNRLLRITSGAIYNVVLDLRKSSSTFGKWQSDLLTSKL